MSLGWESWILTLSVCKCLADESVQNPVFQPLRLDVNDKLSQPASAILVTSDPGEGADRNGKASEAWLLPEEAVPAPCHAVRNACFARIEVHFLYLVLLCYYC